MPASQPESGGGTCGVTRRCGAQILECALARRRPAAPGTSVRSLRSGGVPCPRHAFAAQTYTRRWAAAPNAPEEPRGCVTSFQCMRAKEAGPP